MIKSLKDLEIMEKDKILGEGAFSQVIKVRGKIDGRIYALKTVDLSNISPEDLKNL